VRKSFVQSPLLSLEWTGTWRRSLSIGGKQLFLGCIFSNFWREANRFRLLFSLTLASSPCSVACLELEASKEWSERPMLCKQEVIVILQDAHKRWKKCELTRHNTLNYQLTLVKVRLLLLHTRLLSCLLLIWSQRIKLDCVIFSCNRRCTTLRATCHSAGQLLAGTLLVMLSCWVELLSRLRSTLMTSYQNLAWSIIMFLRKLPRDYRLSLCKNSLRTCQKSVWNISMISWSWILKVHFKSCTHSLRLIHTLEQLIDFPTTARKTSVLMLWLLLIAWDLYWSKS